MPKNSVWCQRNNFVSKKLNLVLKNFRRFQLHYILEKYKFLFLLNGNHLKQLEKTTIQWQEKKINKKSLSPEY